MTKHVVYKAPFIYRNIKGPPFFRIRTEFAYLHYAREYPMTAVQSSIHRLHLKDLSWGTVNRVFRKFRNDTAGGRCLRRNRNV